MTSGQQFVGVGASLQTCGLPVGFSASSQTDPLQLTLQFRLVPVGPLSPLYQRVGEGSLALILQLTFRDDGTLSGASSVVGTSRFSSTPPRLSVTQPSKRRDVAATIS